MISTKRRLFHFFLSLVSGSALVFTTVAHAGISPGLGNWTSAEVGRAQDVSATFDSTSGTVSVTSSSSLVYGTSDGFGYIFKRLLNGGKIQGSVSNISGPADGTAGLMVRGSLRYDAANFYLARNSTGGIRVSWRTSEGAVTKTQTLTGVSVSDFFRLTLSDQTVHLHHSIDDITWSPVLAVTLDVGTRIFGGAVVSSGDLNSPMTAEFSSLEHHWPIVGDGSESTPQFIDSTSATITGSWLETTQDSGEYLNDNVLDDGNTNKGSAEISFPLAQEIGWWEVYLQWDDGNDLDSSVPVTVTSSDADLGGTTVDSRLVNQSVKGGHWVYLGTYYFDPATVTSSLLVSNGGTTQRVSIDGLQLFPVELDTPDSDGDGMPDWWEQRYFGHPTNADPFSNDDGDSPDNITEYQSGTNPNYPDDGTFYDGSLDTDGDGLSDDEEIGGIEISYETEVVMEYTTEVMVEVYDEATGEVYYETQYETVYETTFEYTSEWVYTNSTKEDTDNDLFPDGWEINNSYNPTAADDGNADNDNDGLTAGEEAIYNTSPGNPDSDDDNDLDGDEIKLYGTDPNDPNSNSSNLPPLLDEDGDGLDDDWETTHFGDYSSYSGTQGANDGLLDNDGLDNASEQIAGTDPNNPDSDGDGLTDGDEVYVYLTNPMDPDSDNDNLSDGDEVLLHNTLPKSPDSDDDGFDDDVEIDAETNPNDPASYPGGPLPVIDEDEDGLPDEWELTYFPSIATWAGDDDPDNDNLLNSEEWPLGTNPDDDDTDDDDLLDGAEVQQYNTLPLNADSDGDGLNDGAEILTHLTNPNNPDTDDDQDEDGDEILNNTNPLDPTSNSNSDNDGDGMPNEWEDLHGLDRFDPSDAPRDDDYDRIDNLQEYLNGTNPSLSRNFTQVGNISNILALNELGAVIGASGSALRHTETGTTTILTAPSGHSPVASKTFLNNRNLVVSVFPTTEGAQEMLVFSVDSGTATLVGSQIFQEIVPTTITDSGFVIGHFKEDGGNYQPFRWRDGTFDAFGSPDPDQHFYVKGGNERGEVIGNLGTSGRLWSNGDWISVAGYAMAINDLGQIALRQGGTGSHSYHLRQPEGDSELVASIADSSGTTILTNSSWFLSGDILVNPDGTVQSLIGPEPLPSDPIPGEELYFFSSGINGFADVVGYIHDGYRMSDWAQPDPNNTSAPTGPAHKGVLWQRGSYALDGYGTESTLLGITNSGRIALETVNWVEEVYYYDSDGDGVDEEYSSGTFNMQSTHGVLSPVTDADGNGMPDDWETVHSISIATEDADEDQLNNLEEYVFLTDPNDWDTDDDDLADGWEVTYGYNPTVADDPDDDRDGDWLTALEEYNAGTDPLNTDTDGDGLDDYFEVVLGWNPLLADADGDGESDFEEFQNKTDPLNPNDFTLDEDEGIGDGLPDAWEIYYFTDITSYGPNDDPDNDNLPNHWELTYGLNPTDPTDAGIDSDLDDLTNLEEYTLDTNPRSKDSDLDDLEDGAEQNDHNTRPDLWDTDGDGLSDGYEIANHLNPLLPDSDGDGFTDYWDSKVQFWGRQNQGIAVDANNLVSSWGDSNGGILEFTQIEESSRPTVNAEGDIQISSNTHLEGAAGLRNNISHIVAVATVHNIAGFEEDRKELLRLGDMRIAIVDSQISVAMGNFDLRSHYLIEGEMMVLEIRAERATNTLRVQVNEYPELNLDGFFYYTQGSDPPLLGGHSNSASVDWSELLIFSQSLDETVRSDLMTRISTDHSLTIPVDPPPPPQNADSDGDGMPDWWENLYSFNNSLDDSAGDPDGDQGSNLLEYQSHTHPRVFDDSDEDLMSDFWEADNGLVVGINDANDDADGDRISNLDEYLNGTDPQSNNDSDSDGMPDEWEALYTGLDPNIDDASGDLDGDLLTNLEEYLRGSNPTFVEDSDTDGLPDGWEIAYGLDPDEGGDDLLDADRDLLTNLDEYNYGTSPIVIDSDGDSYPDWIEVGKGTDPMLPSEQPSADFVVDSTSGPYTSIDAALQAATADGQIVQLTAGTYPESIDLGSLSHSLLIIGAGHLESIVEGNADAATIQAPAASPPQLLSAMRISHGYGDLGRGIELGANSQLATTNVVVSGNRIDAGVGAAINANGATLRMENSIVVANNGDSIAHIADGVIELTHCTISNNAVPADEPVIGLSHSTLDVRNSILWNSTIADEIAVLDPDPNASASGIQINGAIASGLEALDSYDAQVESVIDYDPWLNPQGYLTSASAAIDSAVGIGVSTDIQLESRGDTPTTDHGADKFVDTDGDGLPDWFELRHGLDPSDPSDANGLAASGDSYLTAYLNGRDPSDTGIGGSAADPDSDGLLNSEEVTHNTDPNFPDHPLVDLEVDVPAN